MRIRGPECLYKVSTSRLFSEGSKILY